MAITRYKVGVYEINSAEIPYATEVDLTATNVHFPTTTGFGTTDNVYDAILAAIRVLTTQYASSTTVFSHANAAFTTDPNVSLTIANTGTYIIAFNGTSETSGVNVEAYVELFVNGTAEAVSLREVRTSTAILGLITLSTTSIAVPCTIIIRRAFTAGDVVTVRSRVAAGAGNIALNERTLLALQTGL